MITLELGVQYLAPHYPIKLGGCVNVVCENCHPFPDGKKHRKTMQLNFAENIWHCPACDIGGGAIDFWAWRRGINSSSKESQRKEAVKDFHKFIKGENTPPKKVKYLPKVEAVKENSLTSLDNRDAVYREMLGLLKLNNEHKENLKQRGLSDEEIVRNGYVSYPLVNLNGLARALLNKGLSLEGVPGFYKEESKWTFKALKQPEGSKIGGILIPIRTGLGQIQGFQTRYVSANASEEEWVKLEGKYKTLSSRGFSEGTAAKAFVHLTPGFSNYKKVVLTEGPLKGDIIAKFTNLPVLAILGVNSTAELIPYLTQLKARGLQQVLIAFDMDIYENPHVKKALKKLKDQLEEQEIEFLQLEWDREFKGLDDFLLSRKIKSKVSKNSV